MDIEVKAIIEVNSKDSLRFRKRQREVVTYEGSRKSKRCSEGLVAEHHHLGFGVVQFQEVSVSPRLDARQAVRNHIVKGIELSTCREIPIAKVVIRVSSTVKTFENVR